MNASIRLSLHAIATAVALCATLAGCGKSEPPPAPAPPPTPVAAAPAPPDPNVAIKRLAGEVYIYSYPLVLMDLVREAAAARTPPNTFEHDRKTADPATAGAYPNPDVLFSRAWLDLSKEPVVLSFPESRDRYYVMPMIDAWTNVFSSPGVRTTGNEKRDFAVVGPFFKGALPDELTPIKSPTDMVWVVGRIEATGKGGAAAAAKLQERFVATPLSQWKKRPGKAASAAPAKAAASPVDQVAALDAGAYFARVAALLPRNPPAKEDAAMVEKLKSLGIVAGQPFDLSKSPPDKTAAITEGVKSAREAMATSARSNLGDLRSGWSMYWDTGRYGANYGLRAVMAAVNLGANAPEDAIFVTTTFDSQGRKLTGANRYVLHFNKDAAPPAEAFWSLSMYDENRRLVTNPLSRYALGDKDNLTRNADGSIDLYVQKDSPGPDKASNWLPAPAGPFTVTLRIYWPKQDVLSRRWSPPTLSPVT
ncbi:MAG TPA: DUF1254 domain-containing protein [Casimicrobiaceae bacterium]|nr:DUF1254 domain-containing protein [Casimicrobiaceae bacterium]